MLVPLLILIHTQYDPPKNSPDNASLVGFCESEVEAGFKVVDGEIDTVYMTGLYPTADTDTYPV